MFFERAREDALTFISKNEAMVGLIVLRSAKLGISVGSRAGAWLDRWQREAIASGGQTWERFTGAYRDEFLSAERQMRWNVKFQDRNQKADESPTVYLAALRRLATMATKSEADVLAKLHSGLSADLKEKMAPLRLTDIRSLIMSADASWMASQEAREKGQPGGQPTTTATAMVSAARPSRQRDMSTIRCYECQKRGHMARDCPKKKKEDRKAKKPSSIKKAFCDFCEKGGHTDKECFAKKKVDAQMKKFTARKNNKSKETESKKKEDTSSESDVDSSDGSGSGSEQAFGSMKAGSTLPFAGIQIGHLNVEAAVDSAATGGGFVDEETGRGMKWAEEPSKTSSKVEGYGAGGSARYGKAIIAVGGVEDTFTVGVTADLNGKVSCLLGNEVLKRFKIVHDWDRRTIKPKDGREVKITMKTVKGAAHVAFIAKTA